MLFSLMSVIFDGNAANFDYQKAWKSVNANIQKGLPQSALQEVEKIYEIARQEDNQNQIVKSVLFKTRLVLETEELGLEKVIQDLDMYIENSQLPTKQILESFSAEIFQNYYQSQYYRISGRTDLGNFVSTDMRTWAPNNYRDYISKMYLKSLSESAIENIKTRSITELLENVENVDFELRPSLYDLLLDRGLNYFSRSGIQGIQPSFKFELDDETYLKPATHFMQMNISTTDESSMQFQAINLYQLALKRNINNLKAYVNYDIARLGFVRHQGKIANASKLYSNTIDHCVKEYAGTPYVYNYRMLNATLYSEKGELEKAMNEYELILKLDLTENQKNTVLNEINRIQSKNLSVYSELVYTRSEDLVFQIQHRNLNKVHLKLAELSTSDLKKMRASNSEDMKDVFEKLKTIREWTVDVESNKPYSQSDTEVKTNSLPFGVYAIVVSNHHSFKISQNAFNYSLFHVSDIGFHAVHENEQTTLSVVDRNTGIPKSKVEVDVYRQDYDRVRRKQTRNFIKTINTDNNGQVKFNVFGRNNILFVVKSGHDVLDLNSTVYLRNINRTRRTGVRTEIFTDRAIYRPGQTVHFKILGMSLDKHKTPTIRTNESFEVMLQDANYQEVEKLKVVTNEYGSASGSFVLPTGLLTGMFHLSTSGGRKGIQVEEYKRPKFEVNLDDLTEKVSIGDKVSVSGNAMTLSGSTVNGKVSFTVTRSTYFGWWSWYRRVPQNVTQVSSGELKTEGDGSFSFDFRAEADADFDINQNPTYLYEIKVDVTDVAGETRSVNKRISIAALPYSYLINIPTIIEIDDLKTVVIEAKNTNNIGVNSNALIELRELQQPDGWRKKSYWRNQNDNILRKGINPKSDEDLSKYELGELITQKEFEIQSDGTNFDVSKFVKAGRSYELSIRSKENFGESTHITSKSRFVVTDMDKGKLPPLKLLYTSGTEKNWEVNKPIKLTFGTPDHNLKVYYYLLRDWEVIKKGFIEVDECSTFSYTPTDQDKGGISLQLVYVKYNRSFTENHNILIPWSDKKLKVELLTKRDKVLPGSQETWKMKLSGTKADKVTAEILATMYDASLDQFASHSFNFNPYDSHFGNIQINQFGFGLGIAGGLNWNWNQVKYNKVHNSLLPKLRGINYYGLMTHRHKRVMARSGGLPTPEAMDEVVVMSKSAPMMEMDHTTIGSRISGDESANDSSPDAMAYHVDGVRISGDKKVNPPIITPRKNLNETVFFYPDLETDKEGNVLIDFTMNEALTRWKLLTLAHDKDLKYGHASHEVKTQKDLTIVANPPRFFREGDNLAFPATISNLTDQDITANAVLNLVDGITLSTVDSIFNIQEKTQSVTVKAGQSIRVEWFLKVPKDYKSIIQYTVMAWSGNHTDGEENIIPVVTNQKLVTETEVLAVRKSETKSFEIDALGSKSETARPKSFTLEYTSNPVWYAVQALPYMMEFPYMSTEHVLNKFYSNSLAAHIASASPRLQQIFELWKTTNSNELLSNLEKNEELKYALLEETPWVRDAKNEAEQKNRIALLFDMNKMAAEKASMLKVLKERQLSDGGFPWMVGGRSNEYITQSVVAGIAHLEHLGVLTDKESYKDIIIRAIEYLDEKSLKRYKNIKYKKRDNLGHISINYLYIRSFYENQPFWGSSKSAYDYYLEQAKEYWLGKGLYSEAVLGLVLNRKSSSVAFDIKSSLAERSFYSEELGRYWNMGSSYMWYELPIESHAKLIEFFTDMRSDDVFIEDMKIWLLKNKQTNRWHTTKATADAIYALLLQGEGGSMISWVEETNKPNIMLGSKEIDLQNERLEAGTGYFKKSYSSDQITDDMNTVTIKNNGETVGWGATYYQYFEDLDKIVVDNDNPLYITKKLYKEVSTDYGPKLVELSDDSVLEIGDRVMTRIVLKVDRNMSYVHMKDMRPSGFGPENVISRYKWQDGLGYYESTRDLATNFFIDHISKGTYVFEYSMRTVHKGDFSTGITTIQCMYAPEFTSHSQGERIVIR